MLVAMGLSIGVGVLAQLTKEDAEGARWLHAQQAIIKALLEEHQLPAFEESAEREVPREARPAAGSFPYSFLHTLRRYAAHFKVEGAPPPPLQQGQSDPESTAIEEAGALFDFHLLVHSDAEGFYVPVDFDEVIFDSEELGLAGDMLGSSVRLLHELLAVAAPLQIALDGEQLAAGEAARLLQQSEAEAEADPFWRERLVWLALFQAARASIDHQVMIVFS